MANYKCLKQQEYTLGDYSIVPLRYEDRFSIMKWRNEQIYHLRQARPLTEEDQQRYFDNVVAKLFDQSKPDQILFSYLEKGVCVGYGGLVHINWIDNNAEISFIMDTRLEKDPDAQPIWARFYDLEHGEPFVCDRDGIPRRHLSEIGSERRNHYSWYNSRPAMLFPVYKAWLQRYE